MDETYISIEPGDEFVVTDDTDGYPAVKIQNKAFVEDPRWLLFNSPGPDQNRRINELIYALTQLRDAQP
ncbi:hypothetical protein [Paenarthrobacter ureafaciens]|uniref:hypothetical protein n=1 Tax=Paenarthrobacter ureafaciens TaxID=37931 RepID=UPI0009AD04BD|nr:hypothetical protein [Paenarthrobacter ureafaciens]GLU61585.1 hypothetical protein Pure01_40980 [Paenarthrobacter ureafaciens]GLU65836.1 hypothetical protein Pure02_40860 [Paenarthrobacter ureafaciens]GLU70172.1 hypothetical protein Pure03_41480 [Paenarthrobacter ureafaciens]GLU74392.1 hypothetical protein Pure04_41070 [Paenarthrobacter ureafaciens]GLU78631.1 hypothetical protein Pure05_40710 [Paenarthrobacter ureafaciens]